MQSTANVSCPECGACSTVTVHNSVRANKSFLKKRLLDRELFNYSCRKCGSISVLDYSMLYIDNERRFAVWYLSEGCTADLDDALDEFSIMTGNMRKRIVYDLNHLIETILVFDSGLHDLLIFEYKILLEEEAGVSAENMFFDQAKPLSANQMQINFAIPGKNCMAGISARNTRNALQQWNEIEEELDWVNVNMENFIKIYKKFSTRFA